ncbi:uncharacterized protein LOC114386088 isoform X2 [Glycine soja]|uniref:uncharacterized protein LOC114386088 isoform X2 n=1 Tax=Glycine soja TaxID=3848 RepID=UPI001038CB64|nr:uncharacterized protein LOC114386088 isoform X2 [Glycine soja]
MALSLSYAITKPFLRVQDRSSMNCELQRPKNGVVALIRCESKESSSELPEKHFKLEIGSPIIFIEAPKMIKTAATMPCLRVNSGLVKPGDVGSMRSHMRTGTRWCTLPYLDHDI